MIQKRHLMPGSWHEKICNDEAPAKPGKISRN